MTWGFIATKESLKHWRQQIAQQETKNRIISLTNYENAKTVFFRTNDQRVDCHSLTIAVVEGQYCELHFTLYL